VERGAAQVAAQRVIRISETYHCGHGNHRTVWSGAAEAGSLARRRGTRYNEKVPSTLKGGGSVDRPEPPRSDRCLRGTSASRPEVRIACGVTPRGPKPPLAASHELQSGVPWRAGPERAPTRMPCERGNADPPRLPDTQSHQDCTVARVRR
jgi:hypothetical protein